VGSLLLRVSFVGIDRIFANALAVVSCNIPFWKCMHAKKRYWGGYAALLADPDENLFYLVEVENEA